MRSFQTLATLIALMLFASKEATGLPTGLPLNTATSTTGDISPSSTKGPAYPSYPQISSGNTAASNVGTVGNQVGVAARNVNPSSANYARQVNIPPPNGVISTTDTVGDHVDATTGSSSANGPAYLTYLGFPTYFGSPSIPSYPQTPSGNTAASDVGTAGNQVSTASGNVSPTSTNTRREVDAPPPNVTSSTTGTAGNQVGAASGNISPSSSNVGQVPSLPNFPGFPGLIIPSTGNSATNPVGTVGNQVGTATGNIDPDATDA